MYIYMHLQKKNTAKSTVPYAGYASEIFLALISEQKTYIKLLTH